MKVKVYNKEGKATSKTVDLPDDIFGIEPNNHVLYLAVKQYLAAQRQGTHKSKERNEISGSTRKLHKQKGTGGSRKGDINSPLFPGGARVFGPRPRDYSFKLNKKVTALARRSALSLKAKEGMIRVIEDLHIDAPKTKTMVALMQNLEANTNRTLFVAGEHNYNTYLSIRNIPGTEFTTAPDLNAYQIMKAKDIILYESAIHKIIETLS